MNKLYLGMLKNPIATLRLLSFERIRNLFVTLFFASSDEKERIFNHYHHLITDEPVAVEEGKLGDYNHVKRDVPEFDEIEVSIVVPAFNQWELTDNCLRSVIWSVSDIAYEIILADDCSTDATARAETLYRNLIISRPQRNQGFLLNCNDAAKCARGKYIVFLNNDTEVHKYWLEALHRKMDSDERIAICGSKLVYPDGKLQEAGGIIWNDASGWNYGRMDDPSKPEYCYAKDVDYISGASIMVRHSFWNAVGGFDTRFLPAYYEDTDLAFEAVARGMRVVFHPHSVVTHLEGQSHGTDESVGIKANQRENREKFREKWAEKLSTEHIPNATDIFHARDRSGNQRTILIIDHYVPWFDKDAGSRSTLMYIETLLELNYNVKFLGDNFFPHQPYTDALNEMGVEVLHGTYYAQNWKQWIRENRDAIDVAYLHRPHIAPKYIDFIRKETQAKIVYQCHDLHHLRVRQDFRNTGEAYLSSEADSWEEAECALFEKADIGLTFSDSEKAYLDQRFPSSRIFQVPLYLYDSFTENPIAHAERRDILFVGGFGHKPNVEGILWFCNTIWPLVKLRLPELSLKIAGSNAPTAVQDLAGEDVEVLGFVSDDELAQLYRGALVSVLPLLHGAGVKGKLIESMRFATPIVSTSVGLEGIAAEEYGLRAMDSVEDFAAELYSLVSDKESWEKNQTSVKQAFSSRFSKSSFSEICREIF